MSFKGFSIFSSSGHFVQPSGTILAIFVEGHRRNISVKLFWNRATGCKDVVYFILLFLFFVLALVAILFNGGAELFEQFW